MHLALLAGTAALLAACGGPQVGSAPCNQLYRVAGGADSGCAADWRAGTIAPENQIIPRPAALTAHEREIQNLANTIAASPRR
jgi:hypothetical protein